MPFALCGSVWKAGGANRLRYVWGRVALLPQCDVVGYNRVMTSAKERHPLASWDRRKVMAAAIVACALAVLAAFALVPPTLLSGTALVPKEATASENVPAPDVSPSDIPASDGKAYVELNGDVPYFNADEYAGASFERYSPLDAKGRCGACAAMVGPDTMPTEERGEIGEVKPSGWQISKYDWVDGKYLYNRCHLIGYQLTGENANERNLITGTRFMNVQGMERFENEVADYVHRTGNHVLYRVTPLFDGDDLLARGVVMEAQSVEDGGAGVQFCVFCYNEEPGVTIDYATGDNASDGTMEQIWQDWDAYDQQQAAAESGAVAAGEEAAPAETPVPDCDYVLNTNTHKFHVPSCSSVSDMSEKNKYYFSGTRDEAIAQGYEPCKRCNP